MPGEGLDHRQAALDVDAGEVGEYFQRQFDNARAGAGEG
jgi:hypothetical protein